jgi:hypothetical protein
MTKGVVVEYRDDDDGEEVFLYGTSVDESKEADPASRVNANDFSGYDGMITAWPTNDGRFWDVDLSILDAARDTALKCSSNVEHSNSSFFEDFNLDFANERNKVMEGVNEQSMLGSSRLKKMYNEHVSPIRFDVKCKTFAAFLTTTIGLTFQTKAADCMIMLCHSPGVDQTAPHQRPMATWSWDFQ